MLRAKSQGLEKTRVKQRLLGLTGQLQSSTHGSRGPDNIKSVNIVARLERGS